MADAAASRADGALPAHEPYLDGFEHLRDELFRAWLCVAYHIQRRWEMGVLPRNPTDGNAGIWSAGNIAALFSRAVREHAGLDAGEPVTAGDAYEAFRRRSALIEGRVTATEREGRSLPLVEVQRRFSLSPLQRATLTMALMPELDPDLLVAYRYLANDLACRGLDARLLAMLVYESPESRRALSLDLSPQSPLIRYRLLEHDDGPSLGEPAMYRRIQPAPRLVQIAGTLPDDLDPQLRDFAQLAPPPEPGLFPADLSRRVLDALRTPNLALVLSGSRGVGKRLVVQSAAHALGKRVLLIDPGRVEALPKEQLAPTLRGLVREARLLDAFIVVPNVDDVMVSEQRRDELPPGVIRLCQEVEGPIALTFAGRHLPRIDVRPVVQLSLENPSLAHRADLWKRHAGKLGDDGSRTLAERFAIPGGVIRLAAQAAESDGGGTKVEAFDHAVRSQLHDRLSRHGRRLDAPFQWEDLVVEEHIYNTLVDIANAITHRRRVREEWGFRGAPGLSVLFSGSPGVGKTMSATVLARELGLAVYEIDLSSVVSKWIGETEKNLEEIFTAGEPGHAILLFNEADSLFGKRTTDVRNANDRYANLETNYLLQRLEKFAGLAILTTNLVNAIDAAFRRRFAYDVQFTFPTVEMRTELWRRALPAQAEVGEIDFEALAERFELSGGFIKLAIERAAFAAAGAKEPLSTDLIIPTIERMYMERGKLAAIGRLE